MSFLEINECIILDYFNDKLTQNQVNEVEQWYHKSIENKRLFEEVYEIHRISKRASIEHNTNIELSFISFKNKNISLFKKFNIRRISKYAAVFIAAITITSFNIFISYSKGSTDRFTVITSNYERATVKLPDGSTVILNSNTKLDYSEKSWSKDRYVNLTGEAYFDVTPNNTAFNVTTKDVNISVLGTQFNIRSNKFETDVITTLLEGSVCVHSNKFDKEYKLAPGESLKFNTNSGHSNLFSYKNPKNILLWKTGKLTFEQSTLLEIIQTLEQHFNVEIEITNKELELELFTCEFSTQTTIDNILEVLSLTNKISFIKTNKNTIRINKV